MSEPELNLVEPELRFSSRFAKIVSEPNQTEPNFPITNKLEKARKSSHKLKKVCCRFPDAWDIPTNQGRNGILWLTALVAHFPGYVSNKEVGGYSKGNKEHESCNRHPQGPLGTVFIVIHFYIGVWWWIYYICGIKCMMVIKLLHTSWTWRSYPRSISLRSCQFFNNFLMHWGN